jgi:hypothetical protein
MKSGREGNSELQCLLNVDASPCVKLGFEIRASTIRFAEKGRGASITSPCAHINS